MTSWTAVSREQHSSARWHPREGYDFARPLQVVDILLPELAKLLPHYPLAFTRQEESFRAVALLGIGGERNLYVDHNSNWLAAYVPAALRAYPFILVAREGGDRILCLDDAHLVTKGADGDGSHPLFDADGKLAEQTAGILEFLKQCDLARTATMATTQALADVNLFRPWPLKIKRGESHEPLILENLYHIDEQRLNELDAETFAGLRRSGALLLAYAQLLSMAQIEQLSKRAEHLGEQAKARSASDELSNLFNDSGSLKFDHLGE